MTGSDAVVWVPGEPATFLTNREKQWKPLVTAALESVTLASPRLVFRVTSFKRGGHFFDLDNLVKPVLGSVRWTVNSVWASMHLSADPGLALTEQTPPNAPSNSVVIRLEAPPTKSVRRSAPLEELADVLLLGADEPIGMDLAFDGGIDISNFGFEGPIKPVIDLLEPLLGPSTYGPADHRIRELRVRKGQQPGVTGVTVSAWLLDEADG